MTKPTVVSDLQAARDRLDSALCHLTAALIEAQYTRLTPITLNGIQNSIDAAHTLRDRLETIATREELAHRHRKP